MSEGHGGVHVNQNTAVSTGTIVYMNKARGGTGLDEKAAERNECAGFAL
jgi:hypothetical protein